MSIVSLAGQGLIFPSTFTTQPLSMQGTSGGFTLTNLVTLDAAAEKGAYIGHVHWEGHPTAAKTMGATSKIHLRTGTVTFADGSTNLRVGIQDVTTSGVPVQPDGTFDVYKDVVPGGGELSSSSDNAAVSFTLSTSGSKNITEGDQVAIVFDMTARGGSDSVVFAQLASIAYGSSPFTETNLTGTWAVATSSGATFPLVLLEASDGTLGILRGSAFIANGASHTFQSGGTEYGLIFKVPWACAMDGFMIVLGHGTSANADAEVNLYSDPLGTPAVVFTVDLSAEKGINFTDERWRFVQLPQKYTLLPNTNYCLAVKGTGSANVELGYATLANAAHRAVQGFENCSKGSRTSGAFTETTTDIPLIAISICGFDSGQPDPNYIAGLV